MEGTSGFPGGFRVEESSKEHLILQKLARFYLMYLSCLF